MRSPTKTSTHFCGAPIVLNMLVNAGEADRRPLNGAVKVMTAAAPPPPSVLQAMEAAGFRRHPRLRADRMLRPDGGLRLA